MATAMKKPPKKAKPPRANEWQWRLKELPREWHLMVEDFGLTKSTLIKYAERAINGDKAAIERLEPIKQFYLELMGKTRVNRIVRHAEGFDDEGKPLNGRPITFEDEYGDVQMEKEDRSAWGMNDTYDLETAQGAKKPRVSMHFEKVKTYFYHLCQHFEFVKKSVPLKIHGQRPHNPEAIKEAHEAVVKAGPLKVAGQGDKAREAAQKIIDNTEDPVRQDTLTMLLPFLLDGKTAEWDGRD